MGCFGAEVQRPANGRVSFKGFPADADADDARPAVTSCNCYSAVGSEAGSRE